MHEHHDAVQPVHRAPPRPAGPPPSPVMSAANQTRLTGRHRVCRPGAGTTPLDPARQRRSTTSVRGPRRTGRGPRGPGRPRTSSVPDGRPVGGVATAQGDPGGLPGARRRRRTPRAAARRPGSRSTAGAIARTAVGPGAAADQDAPGATAAPWARSASRPSASAQSIPSTAARARCAGVDVSQRAARAARRWRRAGSGCARPRGRAPAPARRRRPARPAPARPSSSWSTPSMPRGGVEHPGGVEGGRPAAGTGRWRRRSRPPCRSGRRRARRRRANDGARRADRDDHVAGAGAEPERGGRVVAGARAEQRTVPASAPGRLGGRRAPRGSDAASPARAPASSRSRRYSPVAGDQ